MNSNFNNDSASSANQSEIIIASIQHNSGSGGSDSGSVVDQYEYEKNNNYILSTREYERYEEEEEEEEVVDQQPLQQQQQHKEVKDIKKSIINNNEIENKFNLIKFLKSLPKLIKSEKKRLIVGFLIINLGFPLYLAYNTPSSMVKIFDEHYEIDATKFGRLYSVYAIPNLIMVFLGGILVDLIGTNKCSIIFSSILTISTVLAALSTTPANYGLLLFSRILLGGGGETLLVCMGCYITQWFEERNHSIMFGIEGTWLQIGSLLAFSVLPSLYHSTNFSISIWFVAIISIVCSLLHFLFIFLQPKLKFKNDDDSGEEGDKIIESTTISQDEQQTTKGNDGEEYFELNIITDDGANINMIDEEKEEDHDNGDVEVKTKLQIFKDNLKQAFQIVKTMPARVWLLSLVSFCAYSSFFGLDIIFTDMAIEKYGYSDSGAGFIMATETLVTAITSPLFGFMVRKLKRNILSMVIGMLMISFGMILIQITPNTVNPTGFVIISGCGYILMSNAIYSSIPILVDSSSQGTAFGLISTSYNTGIVIFPYILTSIRLSTGSYYISIWTLVICSFLGLFGTILLKRFDQKEKDISLRLDRLDYNFFQKKK